MRTGGVQGGEKPDGKPGAVGDSCEVEGGRKKAGVWRRLGGVREVDVAAAVEEGGSWVGCDLPAGGRDFDNFAVGVSKIEKDRVGMMGMAAGGDAPVDGKARCIGESTSFKRTDSLTERIVGRRFVVFAIEGFDVSFAKRWREDGADLLAEGAEGEEDEGLAGGGGEGGGGGGVVEEEFSLGMHLIC